MPVLLARNWWALALRGIAAILFAIVTLAMPGITLAVLVLIFGAYALVDGVFAIVSAIRAARGHRPWGSFLLEGTVGVLVGLITLFLPGVTLAVIIGLVAAWAIITGIFELAAAIRLRRYIAGEWLLILMGGVSILFGIFVFWAPIAGALAIVWWLGIYALIFGILLLGLAIRLRSLHKMSLSADAGASRI
jgi:uncharacterized membrane protein HdeD (DUF308 family)